MGTTFVYTIESPTILLEGGGLVNVGKIVASKSYALKNSQKQPYTRILWKLEITRKNGNFESSLDDRGEDPW